MDNEDPDVESNDQIVTVVHEETVTMPNDPSVRTALKYS